MSFSKYLKFNVSEIEIEKSKIFQHFSPQYLLVKSLFSFLFEVEIECNTQAQTL